MSISLDAPQVTFLFAATVFVLWRILDHLSASARAQGLWRQLAKEQGLLVAKFPLWGWNFLWFVVHILAIAAIYLHWNRVNSDIPCSLTADITPTDYSPTTSCSTVGAEKVCIDTFADPHEYVPCSDVTVPAYYLRPLHLHHTIWFVGVITFFATMLAAKFINQILFSAKSAWGAFANSFLVLVGAVITIIYFARFDSWVSFGLFSAYVFLALVWVIALLTVAIYGGNIFDFHFRFSAQKVASLSRVQIKSKSSSDS